MKYAAASICVVLLANAPSLAQDPGDRSKEVAREPARPFAELAPIGELPAKVGKMVTFDVLIADLSETIDSPTAASILDLESSGKLNSATRVQVSSMEGQAAFVQFGGKVARTVGRTFTGRGFLPIYNDINLGTIVQITSRVEDDGSVLAQFYLERSGLAGGPEQPFDGNDNSPPKAVDMMTAQTTVHLKAGEPQVITARKASSGKEAAKAWIVVTARVGGLALKGLPAGDSRYLVAIVTCALITSSGIEVCTDTNRPTRLRSRNKNAPRQ
jgi:hypothetical protein